MGSLLKKFKSPEYYSSFHCTINNTVNKGYLLGTYLKIGNTAQTSYNTSKWSNIFWTHIHTLLFIIIIIIFIRHFLQT